MNRKLKIVVVAGAVAAVFFAVAGAVVFKTTSSSGFCKSCHLMVPYYDSWSRSAHKNVECTSCHMPPDIKGKLLTKFEALTQIAKYVTRTWGTRPWARIGDESCTGCHKDSDLRNLPVKEFRKGVFFSHAPHLNPEVRHRKLKCTTCHTQVDRSKHMEVLVSACYTCHFKPDDAGHLTRQAECTQCHSKGMRQQDFQESALSHSKIALKAMAPGSDCKSCHKNVVRGDGEVPEYRCYQCHNTVSEVKKELASRDKIHEIHVSKQGVQCNNCHLEIVHKKPKTRPSPAGSDCRQCHGSNHEPQFTLFAGQMVKGGSPSGMFVAGLACASCHRQAAATAAAPNPKSLQVKPENCQPCHSERVAELWTHWVDKAHETIELLKKNLQAVSSDPKSDARATPELKAIEQRLALLDKAHPIHNLPQARKIIEEVDDRIAAVASKETRAALTPLPHRGWEASASCLDCHFTVATAMVKRKGRIFSHEAHRQRIEKKTCLACHAANGGQHGALKDVKACNACHHPEPAKKDEPMKCTTCHEQQRAVFGGKLEVASLDAGKLYGDKSCTDCHDRPATTATRDQVLKRCAGCHDPGYDTKLAENLKAIGARLAALKPEAPAGGPLDAEQYKQLKDALEADGSGGAHNPALYQKALDLLEGKK